MQLDRSAFLPVSRQDMLDRGWYYYDFLLVTGDAYVDHPSFGTAVISRVLEKAGFRVAILAQPDWHGTADFEAMGKPRYGVLINAGNIDSIIRWQSAAAARTPIAPAICPAADRIVLSSCIPTAREKHSPIRR